jgi:bifunctional non-homologous end joining protein LigD
VLLHGSSYSGELVALDHTGLPDFPLVCERLLNRRRHIHLTHVIFDVLSLEGMSLMHERYCERRAHLEALNLNGSFWTTPQPFDDGEALFQAICERGLEGIGAKRKSGRYMPSVRGWVKTKNRHYWRYEMEREGAIRSRRAGSVCLRSPRCARAARGLM